MDQPVQSDATAGSDAPAGQAVGRVLALRRYPLKSASGEDLDAVPVLISGLQDDRRWVLTGPDGQVLTAKQAPRLADVPARVVDDVLEVGGSLAEVVGAHQLVDSRQRTEHQHRTGGPPGNQQVAPVHLVSDGAAVADDAPGGCDPSPRANVVLDLPVAGAERAWVGRQLEVGEVLLRVTRVPRRCLGVYAEVTRPGTVRVGDEVVLLPATGAVRPAEGRR